jgi:DinB superfamily
VPIQRTIEDDSASSRYPALRAPAELQASASTSSRVNDKQVLDMAEDFPAEKYNFKAAPDVRTFAEVVVHAMSGTVYAARAGRGEDVKWTGLDPKQYPDKPAIVAALKKPSPTAMRR